MNRLLMLGLVLISSPARSDDPPPSAPAVSAIVDAEPEESGTFVEYNGNRYGPFDVEEKDVARTEDGAHFALAYTTGPKRWTLVVDGRTSEIIGPDKIHNLEFFRSDKRLALIYHQHWNASTNDILVWIQP